MMNIKNEQLPYKMEHSQITEYQTETFVTQQKCSTHSIPIAAQEDSTLLSFAQQRLWFLDQLEGVNTAYNVPVALQLTGKLNSSALEHSLHELVHRHDILRTTFPAVAGQPQAVIQATEIASLTIIDLQALTAQERAQKREYLIHELITRPFNLAEGPLMRTTLLQLAPQEHILLITLHQIIFDNTSIKILISECAELYQAFCQQKPSPLPPLSIQYADFAVWQRRQFTKTSLATQLSYWKQQLAGVPSLLTLPTDYPRPPVQKFQGTSYQFHFNTALTQALNTLSQQHQVTLLTTLYSAFVCLLARYSGQSDIVVGTPISDRVQPQTEPLIGCFINILALRLTLTDNPSFTQLLKRAQQIISQANAHSELPFEQLIEALNIERNLSYSPLCQVLFVMATPARRALSVPGLTLTPLSVAAPGARFDLSLSIEITEQGLVGMLEYNTDLFEPSTIERFSDHFQTLLASIVTTPEQPIAQLSLLTEAQRHQLLVEWNNTQVDYPQDKCIHQLFEEQVARTPDAVAVVFEEHTLSYQQLNAKANQLARYLQTFDVKPEVLVGLCVERSVDLIVGFLGILKAGGAYVPLNPHNPRQRLQTLLAETTLLITQEKLTSLFLDYQKPMISLDTLSFTQLIQEQPFACPLSADNLAYVIYTSGTTGKPKGVMVQHRSVVNLLTALNQAIYTEQSPLRVSLNGPLFFDTSVKQLIQLLNGHCIDIIPESIRLDGYALLSYLKQHRINVFDCTPTQLKMLIAAGLLDEVHSELRYVLIGGEAIDEALWQQLQQATTGISFFNLYGPTECTVDATLCPLNTVAERPVLGRPIANTLTYILDSDLQPVPVGVPGELYIGGAGVAQGYLNDPALTEQKFIANPLSPQISSRLYKTGDQARYRHDGTIEFLGRNDDQIKLRGFRIEAGDIEASLRQHADIQDAVVVPYEPTAGNTQLIAYVVPRHARLPSIGGHPRYRLPNNLSIVYLNRNEADFLYRELFEEQAYFKHGIRINDGDCIIDVGTNIGLFTLAAHIRARNITVYGFEPNPFVFELAKLNSTLYGVNAKLLNCGLSNRPQTAEFTFYPGFSILSGLYADQQEEKQVVRSYIAKEYEQSSALQEVSEEMLDELLSAKFNSQQLTVPLKTLTEIIEAEQIERIDLLKINVEKSELDVLEGISEHHWPKIRQIVFELHDIQGRLEYAKALLKKHGFRFAVEQDWSLQESTETNYYIYAIHDSIAAQTACAPPTPQLTDPVLHAAEIRAFLQPQLPDYMLPAHFIILEALPLTPNGKVDRQALRRQPDSQSAQKITLPRTVEEKQLAHIWTTVLGLSQPVSIHDNFFALGGHSLLGPQVVFQANQLGLPLTLNQLFQHQTIAELAAVVCGHHDSAPVITLGHNLEDKILPKTDTEIQLAALWHSLLGIHQLGLDDNFYELGGHSLLATQLLSRIRETFKKEISLQTLFEQPTLGQLAHCLERAQPITAIQVQSTSVAEYYPLAGNQYPYWLFEQLYPNTATYNLAFPFKLVGYLDIAALEHAINQIIQDHTALRSTIHPDAQGQPQQHIQADGSLKLTPITLLEPHESLESIIQQEICQPFDLTQERLIRAKLVQLSEQEHILIFTFYHMIVDGWSISLFIQALNQHYAVYTTTQTQPTLTPPLVQYRDFCFWQTQWLQTEEAVAQRTYWQQKLQGPLPVLHLPVAHPRPPVPTYAGQRHQFTISTPLTTALYRLSQQHGVTLFMTVLAAFKTLLYRYSGQTDLLVGTSIAGRRQLQWEQAIGLFMNNLMLRTQVSGSMCFLTLLEQVRNTALAAYQHQDLPFQRVVDSLPRERHLSQATLFQVFFLLQNFDLPTLSLPGLTTTPLATHTGHAKFDLTLELYEREHQLTGWFEYNTTLFTAAVIQRLEQHFQILLEAIVTTPEINLSSLPLLTPLERQHLKYNQWKPQVIFEPEAIEQSLAARFEQQVALYPQKIAVKTRNYEWDYLTLNAQANQVARHLVDLPKRSQQIALLFEHDAPMLVGLLAVLKAGLTYVPLTPDLPIQRLQHIIQDAQISTLVTAQSQWLLAQQLSQGQLPIITIDASLTASCDNLNLPIAADSLAYLLYTSGSTGQPKGVIQNQRNVLHFIRTYTNQLGISANDKLTLFSAYSFDAAVMDIFAALLNGATLYPIDLKKDNNPIAWIKQHAINIFHSTPTVYRHLMGLLTQEERLTAVRWLVLGGEAVYQTDFELYQRHFSEHCTLVNGLGPTESTVTLQYHLTQTTVNSHQAVAVGYPVAETEIILLDEMGNNTEFCGEIGIKSNYLALGYWQRPELTQAAFIPLTANTRLYRSGDMGLMQADGSFEFIGRKDAQVKIRGIRIELEEIEITLNQHPSINNSVVTVWENNNDKRLIAYLILNPGYTQDLNELRLFLKQRLPEYMLPAHLLILESLPLTANGKVDKRALVLPKQLEQKVQESLVAPRDNFEQQLTQIWKKVLKVQSIGIHDNFFDLGGHSLLTVTLLNKIEHQFGQGIMPLIALFQSPTIAQQAKILKEKNYTTTWKALEIIQPQGNHSPLFFIGSTHYARALAIYIGLEQPIYGLNIFGLQSEQGHILKVESIAKQYIQEIKQAQPSGPYYLCSYCADARVAFEMAQQLREEHQEIAFLAFIDVIWHKQNRYYRHWYNLLKFGPEYLVHKTKGNIKYTGLRTKLFFCKLKANWYQNRANSLPLQLQHMMLINEFYKALDHYKPKVYAGKITLFLSSDWRPQYSNTLSQFAQDGVEIQEIPGYHDNLFLSPQVEILGERIKQCLARARATANDTPSQWFVNQEASVHDTSLEQSQAGAAGQVATRPSKIAVNQLEQQLTAIWEAVLGIYPVRPHDNFFDLGGHSLLAITLLNRLEKVLGKTVPLLTLFQAPTIEQLTQVLQQSHESISRSPWVVFQKGDPSKPPLFLIQILGQGLRYGFTLARHLGKEQTVYGLSTGLMEYQHAKAIRGKQAKKLYAELIRTLQPQGPYLLIGVNCGGRTAFEVAQYLYQQGQSVAFLALVDTRVVVQGQVSIQRLSFYKRIKAHGYLLSQHKGDYLRQIPRRLRNKIKRQQRRWKKYYAHFMCRFYLKCKLPLPAHLQEFLFEEAARTEFNYKPKPYPGRLTLFRAQDQKLFEDPEPGWRDVPAGGLELHDIPGNHASIWHEPNVHSLTEKLKNCIQKALEEKQ